MRLPLLLGSLLVLGCSLGESDLGADGGGTFGPGNGGGHEVDAHVSTTEAGGGGTPTQGVGGASDELCTGVAFDIAPNHSHERASASYALAAIAAQTWPSINRSLLSHDEFISYFTRGTADATPFARIRPSETDESVLDLFVTAVPADTAAPIHLILVVDTSTSMRNDLALAGNVVRTLADHLATTAADHLTVIEWGGTPQPFVDAAGNSTVASGEAGQLGEEFESRALALAKTQLGPGASLGPAEAAVSDAIAASDATPHVVIITDGGIVADGDSLAAVERWRADQANPGVVSFIEIAGPSDAGVVEPKSFHRDQLGVLAGVGRGLTHFATEATIADLVSDFDGFFRVAKNGLVPHYDMPQIPAVRIEPDAGDPDGIGGTTVRSGWASVGRPLFTSVPVKTCGTTPFTGSVSIDGGAPLDLPVGRADDPRIQRLGYVDALYELVRGDCSTVDALSLPLKQLPAGNEDITAVVEAIGTICSLAP